ncbi:5-methylcytosine restriction system specificity protein McrC [Fructobacillus fructosus]|uniref:5-methylcytosine restriction system specificity protein McrC n=1 Tax=Fructobacillus fructosus TaxID=1631 RepID=UPI0002194746|nr:hypothetical protein [Fructobacillus fructosus]
MKTLRVKDNASLLKEAFVPISSLVNRVSDKTLGQLEKEGIFVFPDLIKDAEDITREQMIIKSKDNYYKTSNVMGFLGYGDDQLVIESRFSTNEQDYFLQYMLEIVMDFPNILDLNTSANQENQLFNLLVFLFPIYLKSAMRKGVFKTYINNNYNDSNIKGKIDIPRHIKENTPFLGKVAYSKREFSYDNYLMELIRHTIEFIKHQAYGKTLMKKVKKEVDSIVDTTKNYSPQEKIKIIQINKKKPITHAFYHEYRSLQRLCIMILQHEKHQIGSGMKQVHGILFDGAWLWEEYVNSLIQDKFYHPMNKGGNGAQWLFSTKNSKVGLIYPDFISKDTDNRIIADAKYKPMHNIGNRDYLQVLAYMFRFDAHKGYFLYPDQNGDDSLQLKLNQGVTYENDVQPHRDIMVTKCGLIIPDNATSYEDFVMKMKKKEKKFVVRMMG